MNFELNKVLKQLKGDKKAVAIITLGLIGILLIIFSGEDKTDEHADLKVNSDTNLISEVELAEKLEEFIGTIQGVGKTNVIITYECYEEIIYVYDEEVRTQNNVETDYSNEYIIIDNGDNESGLKAKVIAPKIRGVAIVCQGGNNPVIKEMIITAVSAVLDISSNNISVAPMA